MANRRQVLLVDDDKHFNYVMKQILSRDTTLQSCISLEYCPGGEELFAYINAGQRPDYILLDQRMPTMDGVEVLRMLRADDKTAYLPVCMMSSSEDPDLVYEAYKAGANFYFVKPMAFDEIRDSLRSIFTFLSTTVILPTAKTTEVDLEQRRRILYK